MDKGFTLLAIGRKEYGFWARSMAASIKHYSPDVKVQLIHDGEATRDIRLDEKWNYVDDIKLFDVVTTIKQEHYTEAGRLAPGKAKIFLYDYLHFDHSIYLDVDGCCFADVSGLFEITKNKALVSQVWGYGKREDKTYGDLMFWADAEPIWQHFGLNDDAEIPFLNTSFISVVKSLEAHNLYDTAQRAISNPLPIDQMREQWGKGNQPDELYFNVAMALNDYRPSIEGFDPVYFRPYRMYGQPVPLAELQQKYYFLGLWGGRRFNHKSVNDYYDGIMRKVWASVGQTHVHKTHNLMKYKFVETH